MAVIFLAAQFSVQSVPTVYLLANFHRYVTAFTLSCWFSSGSTLLPDDTKSWLGWLLIFCTAKANVAYVLMAELPYRRIISCACAVTDCGLSALQFVVISANILA